ncbi:PDZ and LIM domain protein 3 isoform X7 [Bombus vosnesenskii]|uniref:PDZ and LIM domain protein 3 isoform X7 n=2 Tax=Pyrobombus TaxID=144703 RepID=A0A6J3KFB1_9HYME|nr:PDZ and LIM domain protein 3 isoform X7 [Bombus vancouverensis nearcticus]XP_033307304.1 PDZ and LIM domain protein 3 isoform X7 [Bombus bifarius]XP_033351787.1 PDZ and LIM domain protein 3 isoform X7 [Bombus vosnesenskii]XP_043592465.1 PDZ and LIM domain protein 3 isoform X9 [Bombus pyrosoma]XP_050476426.1 PDZ and LIM domain protein 3 isoform X7 [Bombus huntii]XP_050593201.1 PDZ and LIM domain protein 3 isoform X7 [Bombus affinis]XP_060818734.1 PDZ and LIM domain protein 3 isoform X7 [Bom
MTRKQTVIVKLKRSSTGKPWGIRIAGGADLGTPIVVTRSENETLQRGDVIKKIDDYDTRDVRAKQRKIPSELPKSPVPPPLIDEYRPPASSPEHLNLPHEHLDEVREERANLSQPYRTTPLVLPGAKIKKDAPLGECYLRHHPNPMIRAAPHHYEQAHPEVAMKQKVAETVLQRVLGPNEVPKVVHKQFNSPIGLYSEQNIADTIKSQTTAIPSKKPVKYDPSKSEAYKALQEEALGDVVQEVRQPARTGVFSPQKVNQNRIYHARPKSPAGPYVNILDDDGEKIHQSNSFKRIMYSVLGQTDY